MSKGPLEMIHEKEAPVRGASSWMPLIGLYILILVHVIVNIGWLRADNHPVRSDEEVHMHMARQYFEAMYYDPGASLLDRLLEVTHIPLQMPAHPPLLHVMGASFIAIFGYSMDIITGVNTLNFALVLWGMYLVCRKLLSPWEALFATFVVSLTPLTFMASRFFMTDYLSLAIVVWAIYALLQSDKFQNTGWVFFFAVLNGLGVLTRPTTFLYFLLPCMVIVGLGFLRAVQQTNSETRKGAVRHWLLNCVMTLVVGVGIFSPWYFHHLDEFIDGWTVGHASQGPMVGASLDKDAPWVNWSDDLPSFVDTVYATTDAQDGQATKPSKLSAIKGHIFSPKVRWRDYPIHTINNGAFLVLFLLGVVGMWITLANKRFRNFTTITLLLWLVGSWVFMTLIFKASTPRYTLQALPPLSCFAAMAILSIPGLRVRMVAGGMLSFILLFQFFNLSVYAAGPFKRMDIPVILDARIHENYGDPGIVVYKHDIALGHAYAHLRAPSQDNYRAWTFDVMIAGEQELGNLIRGEFANYLRLNCRGMGFHEMHYWPEPNPYKHPRIPSEALPKRKFRDAGLASNLEELDSKLASADYVVYAIDVAQTKVEAKWQAHLQEKDYIHLGTYTTERGGAMPARNYSVYQRNVEGDAFRIESVEDIAGLNLDDLYTLKNHADFPRLDHRLREAAEARFQELADTGQPTFPMADAIDFVNANVAKVGEDLFEFQLIFKTKKKMPDDLRFYFHGRVADTTQLPPKYQAQGYQDWNFDPTPPTSTWPEDDYVILTHRIEAKAMPWHFVFGLFRGGNDFEGRPVQMNLMDLGKL